MKEGQKRNLERVIQTLHGGERSSMYSCGSFRPTHEHVNIKSAVGSQLNPYKKKKIQTEELFMSGRTHTSIRPK